MGLFTLEEPLWSAATGELLTTSPHTYHIPRAGDIPEILNVSTLTQEEGARWERLKTLNRSRGMGEAGLFLGSAVFFAIRNAVGSTRASNAEKGGNRLEKLVLTSPATTERIRLACEDEIVAMVRRNEEVERSYFSV
jgi:xanthine dehydrogenase/oxidase